MNVWICRCIVYERNLFFSEPSVEVFQPSNKEGFSLGLQLKKWAFISCVFIQNSLFITIIQLCSTMIENICPIFLFLIPFICELSILLCWWFCGAVASQDSEHVHLPAVETPQQWVPEGPAGEETQLVQSWRNHQEVPSRPQHLLPHSQVGLLPWPTWPTDPNQGFWIPSSLGSLALTCIVCSYVPTFQRNI